MISWWKGQPPRRPALSDKLADWQALALVGGETLIRDRVVLDIGPEFALDALWFSEQAKRYVIIDNAHDVLNWASQIAPKAICLDEDVRTLSFADESFDLVLDFGSLDNCGAPFKAYTQLVRVLKKHGILITSYANVDVLGASADDSEIRQSPNVLARFLQEQDMWVRWRDRETQARAVMIAQKAGEPLKVCTYAFTGACICKSEYTNEEIKALNG